MIIYSVLLVFAVLFIFLKQYTGVLVTIAIGMMMYTYSKIPAKEIDCMISKDGIKIGDKIYHFSALKAFWLADILPNPLLYLEQTGKFKPLVSLTLHQNQPVLPIKKVLLSYLPERTERWETIPDKIIRIFKF